MATDLARNLINAGVHYGHGSSRWNPRMKPFIFGKRGSIHIIDVRETIKGLIIAKKLLSDVVASGKDVVFVGTKRQAQKAVRGAAEKCGMHWVTERWLGGTLTNFRTIRSRLQRLEEIEGLAESGKLESESKKQGARLKRELKKIKTNLDGIRKMSRLPGAVVVVDASKEYIALAEAKKLGLPTVAIIDTNGNPDACDVAIPANDDSIKAIKLLLDEMADAISVAKTMAPKVADAQQAAPRPRSRRPTLARARGGEAQTPGENAGEPSRAAPGSHPAP
ncbi:MAG TPA: 30S ribosomal protein S2 [Sedimentisphaerales bacterium]|nr:30S ribosomal protein S2 [Sedimentisphaerales bacterium]